MPPRELPPTSVPILMDWGLFNLSLMLFALAMVGSSIPTLPLAGSARIEIVGAGYLAGMACFFWAVGRLACFRRDGGIHPALLLLYSVIFLSLISTLTS